jgi:HK97 gp10 family phage protein
MAVDTGGSIKVEGLRETIKSLQALGAEKSEIVDANLQAAQSLVDAARPMVPVRSGKLAASLRPSKTVNYAQVAVGKAKVPYAGAIHWGWFYDRKNNKPKNIKPNPFMARALGQNYERIMAQYNETMQKLIDKFGLGEQ